VPERRLFVTYQGVLGPSHAILHEDGKMDWSRHPGYASAIEIPEKYWGVPLREMVAYFEKGTKPKVRDGGKL
jgi:hypothetical protein